MNTYTCIVCNKTFSRYASQIRDPNSATCSVQCRNIKLKTSLKGKNNPNYRTGLYTDVVCVCGNKKDFRAEYCSRCSNKSYPIEGEKVEPDVIKQAIKDGKTFTEVANKLGASRKYIREFAKKNNIDISHFNKCAVRPHKPEEILVLKNGPRRRDNSQVKRIIIKHKLLENKCAICNLTNNWNNLPLVLELDHINGNNLDNRIENLRFLCPNCHTQQPTSKGKKMKYLKSKEKSEV